uniref:Uncharacterized protein n=1 Tax=Anopheles farauti TaxID=69004 RepID=A0A182Q0K7_9DIPT
MQQPNPDGKQENTRVKVRQADEHPSTTKMVHSFGDEMEARVVRKNSQMVHPIDDSPAKLRVSDTRRKKVKQVSSRKNETTRVTTKSAQERKLHTKVVHVAEPFVVHVEKPYPVYIEKPVIVEKHLPIHLYITKKETKHH